MSTPTTRELLEGAARAAGIEGKYVEPGELGENHYGGIVTRVLFKVVQVWNPLHSTADCFEMEVVLGMDLVWQYGRQQVVSSVYPISCRERVADHNNGLKTARMYASTRCAYEISKGMR